jgi:PTS system nitrogen regulatory IIA component
LDGQPVFALFVLVSTTVRVHLHLLARLAYALRNEHVRELVRRRVAGDQFIEAVSRLQTGMGVEGTVKKEQQP